jgi:protein-S-isoprenylcysteine O-methyltransferase Ste14
LLKSRLSGVLVRLRVPFGWVLGLSAGWLARPTPISLAIGLTLAVVGESIRIWAAGYLVKWKGLTRSGPYRRTRNPLYLGSFLVGIGFAVATARWEVGTLLVAFLLGVYLPVMKAEAAKLTEAHPDAYPDYAREVPLLLPLPGRWASSAQERAFSWKRVNENREHVTVLGCLAASLLLWWRMV